MKTDTHGNGNGLNDLYILPDNTQEELLIEDYLNKIDRAYSHTRSDVKGHAWYNQIFIEIPFGENLLPAIKNHINK